ncbi:hypothetical protein SmJEL517_g01581 [Synchytrium microbalum]|uniref:DH domain-containing protein n=1 Tax=Synchytrium microbalum TaxID=1806994 RepID=A0A507CDX3_9FUNG|nr:uncharacterized protein SmJEL517_g01581 [Synchytrium microbalum]TPX36236.1 hypothetical protein SmJEL517_g01581 [Synchytrium microbalum]
MDAVRASVTSMTRNSQRDISVMLTEHDIDSNIGVGASEDKASHAPVIRSRSSFAFHLNGATSAGNIVKSMSKRNLIGPDSRRMREESTDKLKEAAAKGHDDLFLWEISQSFSSVWNHPISRWYFLMFLFFTDHHHIYFFRMDAIQYRAEYHNLHASARRIHAQRIFNQYLGRTAALPVKLWKVEKISVRKAIVACQTSLDHPEAGLFDDLAYIALRNLENVHDGYLGEESNGVSKTDASCDSLKSLNDHALKSFRESAFYQAMQNDLRKSEKRILRREAGAQTLSIGGTRQLTTVQYQRAAERIMDMPPGYFDEPEVWEKFACAVEAMGLDCEAFRQRVVTENANAALKRRRSTNTPVHRVKSSTSLASSAKTATNNEDTDAVSISNSTAESSATPAKLKDPMKRDNPRPATAGLASDRSDLEHTFVQYVNHDVNFCEYCYKRLLHNGDESNAAYRCETCRYVCHKVCRLQMRLSCIKTSIGDDVATEGEEGTEKLRRVADKIQALQKEIDIEMKIRDGLEKVILARGGLGGPKNKKATPQEIEMAAQMDKSNKKLDVLKHEIQKCKAQLAALSTAQIDRTLTNSSSSSTPLPTLPVSVTSASMSTFNASSVLQQSFMAETGTSFISGASMTLTSPMQDMPTGMVFQLGSLAFTSDGPLSPLFSGTTSTSHEGDLVKVSMTDTTSKLKSTGSFFLPAESTVKDLIGTALEKLNRGAKVESYNMVSINEQNEEVPLRYEDKPSRLGVDLVQTTFDLRLKQPEPTAKTVDDSADAKRTQRQKEVLYELIDTEINYATDLKHVVILFLRPLTMSGCMNEADSKEVFSNIRQIADLHEGLAGEMTKCKTDPIGHLNDIIKSLETRVEAFAMYTIYCSNQHNQRRTLQKLREDGTFSKALAQCELTPKLQKLGLADMLVKPMHRVTRYPILLKRLLSYTKPESPEYYSIDSLISRIEEKVGDVNEAVRKREAEFRIHLIDEKMDFNGVVEKFKLANGRRELVSEKPFTYHKKNGQGGAEVLVFTFTDLVLITRSKKDEKIVLFKPPIPFEAAVFLDKPDVPDMKNVFQIVHLQQEIHTIQTVSSYDKNKWLQETNALRTVFCDFYFKFEQDLMRNAATRFQVDGAPSAESSNPPSPALQRKRGHTVNNVSTREVASSLSTSNPLGSNNSLSNMKRQPSWTNLFGGKSTPAPAATPIAASSAGADVDSILMPAMPVSRQAGIIGAWNPASDAIRRSATHSPKSSKEDLTGTRPARTRAATEERRVDTSSNSSSEASTAASTPVSSHMASIAGSGITHKKSASVGFRFGFGYGSNRPESNGREKGPMTP